MVTVVNGELSTGQDGIAIYLESRTEPICEFVTTGVLDQTLQTLRIVEFLHQLGLEVMIETSPEVDVVFQQIGSGQGWKA